MAAWYIWIEKHYLFSLHDRRFMSQAGRTRYFARSAIRARSGYYLLNIRVRSKFSYLEYSVLLLEMFINLVRAFLFVSNHSTWSIAFSAALAREQALVTATPMLQTISIILEIFVANLNIALGGNPFVFNGELRLNGLSLLERRLTCIFLPKSDTFSHRVIIAISKKGESEWRKLVNLGWFWQCNFYFFSLFLGACQAKELPVSLSPCFVFNVPRRRLGQDKLRKMKKQVHFIA